MAAVREIRSSRGRRELYNSLTFLNDDDDSATSSLGHVGMEGRESGNSRSRSRSRCSSRCSSVSESEEEFPSRPEGERSEEEEELPEDEQEGDEDHSDQESEDVEEEPLSQVSDENATEAKTIKKPVEAKTFEGTAEAKTFGASLSSNLQGIQLGCMLIDAVGEIHAFSSGAQEIFGYDDEQVLGENVTFLMSEVNATRHDFYLSRCKQRLEDGLHKEHMAWMEERNVSDKPLSSLALIDYAKSSSREFAHELVTKRSLNVGANTYRNGQREVLAVDSEGNSFPMEVKLHAVLLQGGTLCYVGFVQDLRNISDYQLLNTEQSDMLESLLADKNETNAIDLMKSEKRILNRFGSAHAMFVDILTYTEKTSSITLDEVVAFITDNFQLPILPWWTSKGF